MTEPSKLAADGVSWWRRPWVAPLALGALIFLAFSLPPYLTLDPERTRVPAPDGFSAHYGLLVVHIMFGTVALVTTCLQVWPWLRRHKPAAHRMSGRIYVFGGVLPAAVLSLPIGALSLAGPITRVSSVLLAVLWLGTTIAGYRMARQRRFREHRRWMIRSFALTTSIVMNRVWQWAVDSAMSPFLETTFAGNEAWMAESVNGTAAWLSWTVNLMIAEWWLDRQKRPQRQARKVAVRV
ncbi:MAG: DUF2306 domain-containing protein [Stackebrandtia sp.]